MASTISKQLKNTESIILSGLFSGIIKLNIKQPAIRNKNMGLVNISTELLFITIMEMKTDNMRKHLYHLL